MDWAKTANVLLQIGRYIPQTAIPAEAAIAIIGILKKTNPDLPVLMHELQEGVIVTSDEALEISAAWRAAHPAPKPQ